ncbi:MAG: hypothetical protein D6826_08825, partial [Alphaproteobacteria bacterium]
MDFDDPFLRRIPAFLRRPDAAHSRSSTSGSGADDRTASDLSAPVPRPPATPIAREKIIHGGLPPVPPIFTRAARAQRSRGPAAPSAPLATATDT